MFLPGGSGAGGVETPVTEPDYPVGASGTLEFTANGEDFARSGFTSMDGWAVTFTHVYLCVKNPKAYRQSTGGTDPGGMVDLDDTSADDAYVMDLAQGAGATKIGEEAGVPVGHYSRVSWEMKDLEGTETPVAPVTVADLSNLVAGAPVAGETGTVILVGTAVKGAATVAFTIRVVDVLAYMSTGPHDQNLGRILVHLPLRPPLRGLRRP